MLYLYKTIVSVVRDRRNSNTKIYFCKQSERTLFIYLFHKNEPTVTTGL